jgi:hypothetical protein
MAPRAGVGAALEVVLIVDKVTSGCRNDPVATAPRSFAEGHPVRADVGEAVLDEVSELGVEQELRWLLEAPAPGGVQRHAIEALSGAVAEMKRPWRPLEFEGPGSLGGRSAESLARAPTCYPTTALWRNTCLT